MKTSGIIFIIGLLSLITVGVSSYITAYNLGNQLENQIDTAYQDMENILGQFSLKAVESMGVADKFKSDAAELVKATMQGRYGQNGSQAMFQAFNERGIDLDSKLYLQVQQVIESGRNKFENSQTKFLDKQNVYKTNLGSFWTGLWLKIAGYPKFDLNKYQIISSSHAKEAFDTKIDKGISFK
jgi:hypothetical protein